MAGEVEVDNSLKNLNDEVYLAADFKLPSGRQLDHVVIGPTGVFVIETKNYCSLIFLDFVVLQVRDFLYRFRFG